MRIGARIVDEIKNSTILDYLYNIEGDMEAFSRTQGIFVFVTFETWILASKLLAEVLT